ncbi:MAG: UDP-glucose 4-epimerase, partial [Gammaproteobacteria bacterium]|nr:UDP-glucose 4-epimerase [Gemmatimonadota bacterium]NIU78223.1 UDP-glucose 4-epimerase [Gammaproteobacteria bacterium]
MEDVDAVAFNVGTGIETSVTALAEELLAATTVRVPIEHAPARAGELGRSAVDATRAGTEWGWRA